MDSRGCLGSVLKGTKLTGFLAVSLVASALLTPAWADSQVRIVRLSEVDGTVDINRNTTQRYEKALLNLPVTQGTQLRTASDGRVEVEFENGSTLRLTPDSLVDFRQLSLLSSGAKLSSLQLSTGTAYLNFLGGGDDVLELAFGGKVLHLTKSAHLRLEVGDASASLAVFQGNVEVKDPAGNFEVGKNHTASMDLDGGRHRLVSSLEQDPYDGWDKQEQQYHERYTDTAEDNYSPYAFGTADLSYYGSFFDVPPYGMIWQPYFVGAGWDPFLEGAWAFEPGLGFGWVSAYPWGWTPYHLGTWVNLPQFGWAWQPGGTWSGLGIIPRVVNAPRDFVPPRPPVEGRGTVLVSRTAAADRNHQASGRLLIRNNSAGLGVPRGAVKDMHGTAALVGREGVAAPRLHSFEVPDAVSRDARSGREIVAEPVGLGTGFNSTGAPTSPLSSSTTAGSAHSGSSPHR